MLSKDNYLWTKCTTVFVHHGVLALFQVQVTWRPILPFCTHTYMYIYISAHIVYIYILNTDPIILKVHSNIILDWLSSVLFWRSSEFSTRPRESSPNKFLNNHGTWCTSCICMFGNWLSVIIRTTASGVARILVKERP